LRKGVFKGGGTKVTCDKVPKAVRVQGLFLGDRKGTKFKSQGNFRKRPERGLMHTKAR